MGFLRLLERDSNEGEAEAIGLSLEGEATLLLLDEADARAVAELYGLPKTGTVGLLIRAKNEGLVDLLRPELDSLIQREASGSPSLSIVETSRP